MLKLQRNYSGNLDTIKKCNFYNGYICSAPEFFAQSGFFHFFNHSNRYGHGKIRSKPIANQCTFFAPLKAEAKNFIRAKCESHGKGNILLEASWF